MEAVYFVVPFVLLGIAVVFVAFSGGAGAARQAYLSRGGRGFRILMLLLYVAAGIAVPAAVIAGRGEAEGGVGPLGRGGLRGGALRGKQLSSHPGGGCHTRDGVTAGGVTGP